MFAPKQLGCSLSWLQRCHRSFKQFRSAWGWRKFPFLNAYPPGHDYSPIPDMEELLERENGPFGTMPGSCPAIDLREEAQLELLSELSAYYAELTFPETRLSPSRYYYENEYYSYGDPIVLLCMLRYYKRTNVIEVGSGFSSAAMLDVNEGFFRGSISLTFVEPFPDRLQSLFAGDDEGRCRMIRKPLQDVEVELFEGLNANDVLFVDSSHVVKAGSDVARIVFEVLPRLKPGVLIHSHDILWPFEYPKEWLMAGRAWNEAYFVRAFLEYNQAFKMVYFNSFMGSVHAQEVQEKLLL